jgi:tetratricopeptide (TPR) repeat protein
MVLYRAGSYEQSFKQLTEADRLVRDPGERPNFSPAYAWLFLAMAEHRLGHAAEAKRWLDKAGQWIEISVRDSTAGVGEWISARRRTMLGHFRQEAETLMKAKAARLTDAPLLQPAPAHFDRNRALRDIADAHYDRGCALMDKGEADQAIAAFSKAIRVWGPTVEYFVARGQAYASQGNREQALADFHEAIQLDPHCANTYCNRGEARSSKGEYDKAIADYNVAIQLDPNHAMAHYNLAWLYATCPNEKYRDGKMAVENANKAYQSTEGKDWAGIDTLAAACAENRDFEKAKQWGAKAIELAATDKSVTDKNKAELASRLELYKQGKPYREGPKK